jgi:hypothetical protein
MNDNTFGELRIKKVLSAIEALINEGEWAEASVAARSLSKILSNAVFCEAADELGQQCNHLADFKVTSYMNEFSSKPGTSSETIRVCSNHCQVLLQERIGAEFYITSLLDQNVPVYIATEVNDVQ